jgi:hypothetical protein
MAITVKLSAAVGSIFPHMKLIRLFVLCKLKNIERLNNPVINASL